MDTPVEVYLRKLTNLFESLQALVFCQLNLCTLISNPQSCALQVTLES
jgi:hypothetical protein